MRAHLPIQPTVTFNNHLILKQFPKRRLLRVLSTGLENVMATPFCGPNTARKEGPRVQAVTLSLQAAKYQKQSEDGGPGTPPSPGLLAKAHPTWPHVVPVALFSPYQPWKAPWPISWLKFGTTGSQGSPAPTPHTSALDIIWYSPTSLPSSNTVCCK